MSRKGFVVLRWVSHIGYWERLRTVRDYYKALEFKEQLELSGHKVKVDCCDFFKSDWSDLCELGQKYLEGVEK